MFEWLILKTWLGVKARRGTGPVRREIAKGVAQLKKAGKVRGKPDIVFIWEKEFWQSESDIYNERAKPYEEKAAKHFEKAGQLKSQIAIESQRLQQEAAATGEQAEAELKREQEQGSNRIRPAISMEDKDRRTNELAERQFSSKETFIAPSASTLEEQTKTLRANLEPTTPEIAAKLVFN